MPTKQIYVDYAYNGAGIHGVADAVLPTDVPNYGQVQAFAFGLAWKQAVRVASTSNITLTAPGASIDGVTLVSGNRVLLKNQSNSVENGPYVFNSATTALTRATDGDTGQKLQAATVSVSEGQTNKDTAWNQTADSVTVGTTPLTWVQVSGQGLYTQGNGIAIQNNQVSAVAAPGGGLIVTGAGIAIDTSITTRKVALTVSGATAVTVAHNLATFDVVVAVYDATTNEQIDVGVVRTNANVVTLSLVAFPASLRVVVIG
jgi:hypothetical protein